MSNNSNGNNRFESLDNSNQNDSVTFEAKLYSYYCKICNEHCFVCGSSLGDLPNRKTDKSKVIPVGTFAKIYAQNGETIHIKRKGGIERQIRLKCKSCGVSVGYYCKETNNANTNSGFSIENQHIYIFQDVVI